MDTNDIMPPISTDPRINARSNFSQQIMAKVLCYCGDITDLAVHPSLQTIIELSLAYEAAAYYEIGDV